MDALLDRLGEAFNLRVRIRTKKVPVKKAPSAEEVYNQNIESLEEQLEQSTAVADDWIFDDMSSMSLQSQQTFSSDRSARSNSSSGIGAYDSDYESYVVFKKPSAASIQENSGFSPRDKQTTDLSEEQVSEFSRVQSHLSGDTSRQTSESATIDSLTTSSAETESHLSGDTSRNNIQTAWDDQSSKDVYTAVEPEQFMLQKLGADLLTALDSSAEDSQTSESATIDSLTTSSAETESHLSGNTSRSAEGLNNIQTALDEFSSRDVDTAVEPEQFILQKLGADLSDLRTAIESSSAIDVHTALESGLQGAEVAGTQG